MINVHIFLQLIKEAPHYREFGREGKGNPFFLNLQKLLERIILKLILGMYIVMVFF